MKGLAWPLGKKVAGVSTLAALALNIPFSSRLVCPVLDARKGEVYGALLDELADLGLLEGDKGGVRLTERGRMLGNQVFARFV